MSEMQAGGEAPEPSPSFSGAVVRRGAGWLRGAGADADVVVSSRIRLARNLAGFPFLCRADRRQRQTILEMASARLLMLGGGPSPAGGVAGRDAGGEGGGNAGSVRICEQVLWVNVHEAPSLDRTLLVERHLISKEHARGPNPYVATASGATAPGASAGSEAMLGGPKKGSGGGGGAAQGAGGAGGSGAAEPRGVAISLPDESLSVMVNEEDHLRLQVLLSGLEISAAYEQISRVDDFLEGPCGNGPGVPALEYAYSGRFGYLTACPTNVGTGIRVSVMLHLPGLKLVGEMDKVRRATRDMSLAVRGYYGEGSEAAGEFFQISNQTTLGKSEASILHELEREIVPQIVQYERAARRMLLDKRRRLLEDKVFRALGTLRHARLLTPEEAIMLLSDVRLGALTGLIKDVGVHQVNQLILLTQPAHLQRALGREMDQGERREARADLVRESLSL